jgi:diguanylate cyclase
MNDFFTIAAWVFGSITLGIGVGLFYSRIFTDVQEPSEPSEETQAALRMLVELLGSAEHIVNNVENHNTTIQENVQQIDKLHVTGEMETIKQTLLRHMTTLVESNERLKEDLVCTQYRLEEQAQEIDHARQEARSDELTGVANRRAFNEKLHLLMDAWRRENEPFALILADLDQFKRVNDSHGHPMGDHVLKVAGDGLKELIRATDFIGRYGGDEFAILLPKVNQEIALQVAQRICRGIADALCRSLLDIKVSVTLSMGVTLPCQGDTDESILKRVDQALYRAKQTGRNKVVLYQESDMDAAMAPYLDQHGLPDADTIE